MGVNRTRQNVSRIVLPWHPFLSRVNAKLRAVDSSFAALGFPELQPHVAWCLGAKSVQQRMQADAQIKLRRVREDNNS